MCSFCMPIHHMVHFPIHSAANNCAIINFYDGGGGGGGAQRNGSFCMPIHHMMAFPILPVLYVIVHVSTLCGNRV